MSAIFNLVVVGLVLLIAYWWANQGLFSSLLHLVCVIAAGAIALAIWEPLVAGLLLQGSFFDNYAWGVGLIGPFAILLLIFRIALDKSIPANVDLPRWADLTFGGLAGAGSGVLTVGLLVIGCGFIQSAPEVMGFTGYARSRDRGSQIGEVQSMWLPVHTLTNSFYSFLSAGSLYPTFNDTPLNQYYPDLDQVSMSLHRDTFNKGRGKTSLVPKDAKVQRVITCETCSPKRIAVEVLFDAGARDYGEQLTVSSAQIRLLGDPPGASPFVEAKAAFPIEWTQYSGHHKFDDLTHYITSEPAQAQSLTIIEFNAGDLGTQTPKFIQIRGTRYALPRPGTPQWEALAEADYHKALRATGATGVRQGIQLAETSTDITGSVRVGSDIRPVMLSINRLPAGLEYTRSDERNYLSGGDGEVPSSGDRPGRGLAIEGILEPKGTKVVQVDVSRSSPATLIREDLVNLINSNNPVIQLVDTEGRGYVPIGFIHTLPAGKTRIKIDMQDYVRTRNELPDLPTSDTHRLRLLFLVTQGATISGLKLGDATLGRCSVPVLGEGTQQPAPNTPGAAPSGLGG
jgi:hypothetical protein